jgi:hypothetical protein
VVEQQLRSLGLRLRAPERPPELPDDVRTPTGRPPAARVGWEGRLMAQKPVGEPWEAKHRAAVSLARQRYDAGTHYMATHVTKDGWQQLYSWPRQTPAAPQAYFNRPGVA